MAVLSGAPLSGEAAKTRTRTSGEAARKIKPSYSRPNLLLVSLPSPVRESDVPYMTIDWKKAIKNKRKFAKLYARNKTDENFELKNVVQKCGHEKAQESN